MGKIKLRVLSEDDTPENAKRRVLLSKDDGFQEWVRDTQENTFLLWSRVRDLRSDKIKGDEVESPYEEILDEEGYCTGKYKLRDGLLVLPVDMYVHSGTSFSLHGDKGYHDMFDTTSGALVLYCDQKRWESLGGSAKWVFVDGKPSAELLEDAKRIARAEIREMNLCEDGSYYGWREQHLTEEASMVVRTLWNGKTEDCNRVYKLWEEDSECDSCWGILTDKPAEDSDFPVGIPVVTDCANCDGDTFTQECWAIMDDVTGKYLATFDSTPELTDDVNKALLHGSRSFLEGNRKWYEDDMGRALTVVDVTERVWAAYPECVVREEKEGNE